jgi:flavin reductase (DIM6/NTAB) family NADH-FMN oxidoreductase RutF
MAGRPLPADPGGLRAIMGLFATGVGLVTTQAGTRIHGMTANSITSVSLDPLLVLVCVGKQARLVGFLRETGNFVVNLLTRDQEAVARHFARSKRGEPPELSFAPWECGPRLTGALGYLACRTEQTIEAGDHWIVVGRVVALAEGARDAEPLLFYAGQYRRLRPASEELAEAPPDLMSVTGASIHYGEWA